MNDKDKSAINHIASVSKHPHAHMIVKWLITGWDVKLGGKVTNNPYWHRDFEYELIEPKPAKPAYRVYKLNNGLTSTIERDEHGNVVDMLGSFKTVAISEWIEYDQPKKWPTPLVQRIAAIDLDAAQWIVYNWDDLMDGRYSESFPVGRESDSLISMFTWSSTPQGKDYWHYISKQLGE